MAANVWGSRDLAYAALTYGRQIAVQARDDLRETHLAATTAWVNLRDGRTAQGFALAAARADRIEPRMSEHDPDRLSVYGQFVTNAAVAARPPRINRSHGDQQRTGRVGIQTGP
ncbi:hypothetical protein [Streptomyces sp. LN785]|uniref:hypothetical protein n=1 Tax=Streptomyces sp. LN785 TaxID=3112983 RepID=UPI00371164EA